jgi:nucleotide-binding universal stress UspA family protein
MKTIHRIVYATDLSPASEPAWGEAQLLGKLLRAEVVVLHTVAPPPVIPIEAYVPPEAYAELLRSARREAQKGLDRLVEGAAGSGLTVRIRLEDGSAAQRILDVVAEEGADLLVVGTHGRAGIQRAFLGSVADRMMRQARCPVMTVRSAPAGEPRREIRRICYATDFSPAARAAWPWAVAIASAAAAEVELVHVTFEPAADKHLSAETIGRMARLLHEQGRMEAERFLEGTTLPRERIRVRLTSGDPGEQIVRRAQEQGADLVVMGTHGWSGVVRWMLGSVANHVIQAAACPVLTVSPVGGPEAGRPDPSAGGVRR